MNSLGKQAVSTGSINQRVEIALLFLLCVFKKNSQYSLKSLVTPFFTKWTSTVLFENKAYRKPCRVLDKSVIQISYFST